MIKLTSNVVKKGFNADPVTASDRLAPLIAFCVKRTKMCLGL